ncbi:MAG: hypothetical protein ACLP5H_30725 [Desulfomonilaceae bacterium]
MGGLCKAFSLSHCLWGGRFNPVIPVGQADLASQIVKLFRVDILIPISQDKAVSRFISQFPYLPSPLVHPELFIEGISGKPVAQVLDLCHPIRRLHEKFVKTNAKPSLDATVYTWNKDDPLGIVLLATLGGFPSEAEVGTDFCALIEQYLGAERIHLTPDGKLHLDVFKKATPNWITCSGLELYHYDINSSGGAPGFYVGKVTDFDDLVNYWNLRATGTELLFCDFAIGDRLNEVRATFLDELKHQFTGRDDSHARAAIWHKGWDEEIDLAAFGSGTGLEEHFVGPWTWNGLNLRAPMFHFGEKSVLASVASNFGKTTTSFALPEKSFLKDPERCHQHFVASINCGVGLYGYERETMTTLFIPELNEFYGRNCYFDWTKARVEPDGIGIIIRGWEEDLTLTALDVSSLISRAFEIAGISAQPSRTPGLIASRLIQQFGGLQGTRVFKIRGVRDLIRHYNPDQSFTRSAAQQIIGQVDPTTGRPNFINYEDLPIGQGRRKLQPGDVFTHLVKSGAFRVGLDLECPNCLLNFWLSLDEVRSRSICEYCGEQFDITPQLKDRDWRYRRSGLFGKENNQEGAIPVLVLLQQMHTAFSFHDFLYSTAMKLKSVTAPISPCETDFVVLTQKKPNCEVQIAIGECKDHQEITESDVSNLRAVAEALEAKGIRTFIIFSKLSDFTPDELQRCNRANDQHSQRLILLTARELEPYRLYERTAKEFDIREHASSFEEMADVTQRVFCDKCTKRPVNNPPD